MTVDTYRPKVSSFQPVQQASQAPSPPTAEPADRWPRRGRPRGVHVATAGWLLLCGTHVLVGLGGQETRAGSVLVGRELVAATTGGPAGAVAMLGAVLAGVLALAVFHGHGWAVYPLVIQGALAVVLLALVPSWLALLAMLALVLGTAPLATPRAYSYLTGASA